MTKAPLAKPRRSARFTPSKGGDGGTYVPVRRPEHWDDNGKVVLTGDSIRGSERRGFLDSLLPTTDASDVAHCERVALSGIPPELDDAWRLADPATVRQRGRYKRRRYHRSQVTSRGIAYDSMWDSVAKAAAFFQNAGIELGLRTSFPREASHDLAEADYTRARVLAGKTAHEARDMLHPETRCAMTRKERELEDAANRLLERGSARNARAGF